VSYYTPGGSNLIGNPHAPRMGAAQAREFMSHVKVRKTPTWMKKLQVEQNTTQGFSCHGLWEDSLACMDSCADCPFLQMDGPEQQKEAEYYSWVLEVAQAEIGG
jgi:hypothetical protein